MLDVSVAWPSYYKYSIEISKPKNKSPEGLKFKALY